MVQLVGLLLLCSSPDVAPATASTPAAPYQVTVCVRPSRNRLLTPWYVESVRRQVQDQLAILFGPLANIQVLTAGHWLVDEFEGCPIDEPALSTELLTRRGLRNRVYLVTLDYSDSLYHIAWRQIDGNAGFIGNISRRSIPDRQWVAKSVCLAIVNEFALVANVERSSAGSVLLDFRGSNHLPDLLKIIGDESIWQPYFVIQQNGAVQQRRAVPYTLIRVQRNQLSQPELISNLPNPFPQRASIVGIEALKLPVQTGRLRLRLIDLTTGSPVINCAVSANDRGFDAITDADLLDRPDREGYVVSRGEFRHLAYVKIMTGGVVATKFPLPITGPWCEFEVKVAADSKAHEKNDFERLLLALTQDLSLLESFQAATVKQVNELNSTKRYEEALKRVSADLESIQPSLKSAQNNLDSLQRQAREIDPAAAASLEVADKQLGQRQKRNRELSELKVSIELAINTRDAQNRANVQIKLAQQAEQDGNGDEAIARYEFALSEQPNQPELREKLAKLKKLWDQKIPARRFVYDRWSSATLTEIVALLPEAEMAVGALQSAGDYLSLQKFLAANNAHAAAVSAFVEQVASRTEEADKQEAEKYAQILQRVADLQKKVGDALIQLIDEGGAAGTATDAQAASGAESGPPGAGVKKKDAAAEEESPLK